MTLACEFHSQLYKWTIVKEIISFLAKTDKLWWNGDFYNSTACFVSLAQFMFYWWRHNRLCNGWWESLVVTRGREMLYHQIIVVLGPGLSLILDQGITCTNDNMLQMDPKQKLPNIPCKDPCNLVAYNFASGGTWDQSCFTNVTKMFDVIKQIKVARHFRTYTPSLILFNLTHYSQNPRKLFMLYYALSDVSQIDLVALVYFKNSKAAYIYICIYMCVCVCVCARLGMHDVRMCPCTWIYLQDARCNFSL